MMLSTFILVLLWMLLVVFCLWVLVRHTTKTIGTFVLIPLLLFTVCSSWYIIESTQGYASYSMPAEKSILIYGVSAKPLIYLLVHDGKYPRLHAIDWTKKRESELARGMKSKEEGHSVRVEHNKQGMRLYKFDLPKLPEK